LKCGVSEAVEDARFSFRNAEKIKTAGALNDKRQLKRFKKYLWFPCFYRWWFAWHGKL